MHKNIKKIDVVYENCEVTSIPAENIVIADVLIRDRWIWCNQYCTGKENAKYATGHLSASRAWLIAELKGLSDEDKNYLRTRKDITHLDIVYEDGTNDYICVPYPSYFICWMPNPYQITYEDDESVDLRIEPHWSIVGFRYWVKDRVKQIFHNFPTGLRCMLDGYWGSFKRHFRWRD